jgi:hypothetical protein
LLFTAAKWGPSKKKNGKTDDYTNNKNDCNAAVNVPKNKLNRFNYLRKDR